MALFQSVGLVLLLIVMSSNSARYGIMACRELFKKFSISFFGN